MIYSDTDAEADAKEHVKYVLATETAYATSEDATITAYSDGYSLELVTTS